MKNFKIFFAIILMSVWSLPLYADGSYYVGKDEGGIFFQTDKDGGWYIDEQDLKYFRIGESGSYSLKKDRNGSYLITDKKRKFYLHFLSKQQLELEIADYNSQQPKLGLSRVTRVIINGHRVLVPVTIGYSGKKIKGLLLLDTGASMVTLHRDFTMKLKIEPGRKAQLMVVGGKTISADLVKLDFVDVDGEKKDNIHAVIVDHNGPPVQYNGLLGMNFLKGLDYKIEFEKCVIRWK